MNVWHGVLIYSKWGGLIPNFSMGHRYNKSGIRILNPFSVSFPWSSIPKWILYGDKWARNSNSPTDLMGVTSPYSSPFSNILLGNISPRHTAMNATMNTTSLSKNSSNTNNLLYSNCGVGTMMSPPTFDSSGSMKNFKIARDIWKTAAPNISTLELENPQKNL